VLPARRLFGALLCLAMVGAALCAPRPAAAAGGGSFTVSKIRVVGLERISRATVLTYIPGIGVGQKVDSTDISQAIRNLYQTGFFRRVQFRRDGSTLIIAVKERPTIAAVRLVGNKEIKTDALRKGLQKAGLTQGSFFNRAALSGIKGSLTQTYFDHGRYGVRINAKVISLPNNRVALDIHINEGASAKVLSINFTGNKAISSGTLRDQFKMTTPGWFTWITDKDKYEEEKLRGSLENIRSYYMNRGYADFSIKSVQVQLSPDKSGVYVNVNLHEGGKYQVGKVKLLGKFPIPEKQLEKRLFIKKGTTFSMQLANAQAQVLTNVLGAYGYGFAKVSPLPKPDPKTNKVELVFYVQPGQRVYVHHVVFTGAEGTDDAVFRREMRQLEGSWLNNLELKRSRVRIQRLPFVDSVDVKPKKIPGSPDQVDVHVHVKQRQSGTANIYLSYSGYYGLGAGGQVALSNFLGQGKQVHLNVNKNTVQTSASLSYTNPYATTYGVSRTASIFYSKGQSLTRTTSDFQTRNYGGSLTYGFPLSEFDSYSLGATIRHGVLTPYCYSPTQFQNFVSDPSNGNVDVLDSYCKGADQSVPFNQKLSVLTYNNLIATVGYSHDTRNRTVLPSRGTLQHFSLNVAIPPGSERYYTAAWNQTTFIPIAAGFVYGVNSLVSVANSYGKTGSVPPYEHFFAGGPQSVAGYKEATMGPRDSNGNPYGGDFVSWVQNELILPNFIGGSKSKHSYRAAFFVDAGNVFARPGDFRVRDLRASYGVGLTWLTPIGALHFSYAIPFRTKPGDQLSRFQFSLGAYF